MWIWLAGWCLDAISLRTFRLEIRECMARSGPLLLPCLPHLAFAAGVGLAVSFRPVSSVSAFRGRCVFCLRSLKDTTRTTCLAMLAVALIRPPLTALLGTLTKALRCQSPAPPTLRYVRLPLDVSKASEPHEVVCSVGVWCAGEMDCWMSTPWKEMLRVCNDSMV